MDIWDLKEEDPFTIGSDDFRKIKGKYIRLEDASIFFCARGQAHIGIDLQEYELVKGTQVVLLPGRVLHVASMSEDFRLLYIGFSNQFFHEITNRLEPTFFRFLKENPCVILPGGQTEQVHILARGITYIYQDRENMFRIQIARNYIQSFLLNIYDKTKRFFAQPDNEGISRQEELFKRFIQHIHRHCATHREVSFYAEKLYITPRYLSTIVQNVGHATAKSIIDHHVIVEIKTALKTTNFSIQEISNQMNFPDQSFFGRYFKKHTGMSPLQYRNEG